LEGEKGPQEAKTAVFVVSDVKNGVSRVATGGMAKKNHFFALERYSHRAVYPKKACFWAFFRNSTRKSPLFGKSPVFPLSGVLAPKNGRFCLLETLFYENGARSTLFSECWRAFSLL